MIPTLNVPLSPHLAVLSGVRRSSSSAMRLMECCVKCSPSRRRRGTADGLSHIPRGSCFFARLRPISDPPRRGCCRRDEMNASSECSALCPLRRASSTLVRPVYPSCSCAPFKERRANYIVYVTYPHHELRANNADAAFCRRHHGYWGGVRS